MIFQNNKITAYMLREKLKVSQSTIERDIKKLQQGNKLKRYGHSKSGYWIVDYSNKKEN